MNRKYRVRKPPLANGWKLAVLTVFFNVTSVAVPCSSNAQYTIDGTNCIIFADMFDGELARCVKYQADGSTLKISLIGKRPNEVASIELSKNGLPPFQVVAIAAQPTIDHQNVGLLLTDMNFDRHIDFAVMKTSSAGPLTPYLYFIFNTQTGMFKINAALAKISTPMFDARTNTIVSQWRKGAGKSGRDNYVWRGGKLVLVNRFERNNSGTRCVESIYEETNGALQLIKTEACTD